MESRSPSPEARELRLRHLAENIRNSLQLLHEYEDALLYEDDPRRKTSYRRQIEELKGQADCYQQEFETLRATEAALPSPVEPEIASALEQMNAKIDSVLSEQGQITGRVNDLEQTLLARFDKSDQAV